MRNSLSLLFLFFLLGRAIAQPTADLAALKAKHGQHNAVLLKHVVHYEVGVGKKGIEASIHTTEQICHLEVKGTITTSDRVTYDPHFYTISSLDACTWVPGEKGFEKKKVTEFHDLQSLDNEAFLDSKRHKEFLYPLVRSGAVTECNYTLELIDPGGLGSFHFAQPIPLVYGEVSVTVTDDIELGVSKFGPQDNVEYTVVTKGKNTTHTWIVRDVEAFREMDYLMSDDLFRPHIFVYVKSYRQNGKTIPHLGTVADLYNYNYKYIRDRSTEADGLLATVVDSIVRTHTDETEIVRGIYQWVQDNVRYIAMEEGMGGFVPRPAKWVCEKKYGDCKDMANLIKSMLDRAGIPGYLCWVGTRSIGYSYDQLPLPNADNHMIAAYKKDGEYTFLDATSKEDPFGMPSWAIQGKQTMISIDEAHFEVPFIPVVPAYDNRQIDHVQVRLEGQDLVLTGNVEMHGYSRSFTSSRVKDAGPQHEKEAWKYILERASNKCNLLSYQARYIDDRDVPLEVDYSLRIPDYARVIANELYVNLNLNTSLKDMRPDTLGRYCGVEFHHTIHDESVYTFNIPEGYSVRKLPEALHLSRENYEFVFTNEAVGNEIRVSKKFILKDLYIEPEYLDQWLADLAEVEKAFQQVVVFVKD